MTDKDSELMPPPAKQEKQLFPSLQSYQRVNTGRKRPQLNPGHSPMDWATLTQSNKDLRNGRVQLSRFTAEEIATHNKKQDLWMIIHGKVYDLTAYMPFHPGGEYQLLRAAGKDGTKLITEIHPWVNIDMMLDKCCIGYAINVGMSV